MKHLLIVSSAILTFILLANTSTNAQVTVNFQTENSVTPQSKRTKTPETSNETKPIIEIEKCSKLQFKYAQIIKTEVENIENEKLFSFIDEWWHVRYRFGGMSKKGVDCSAYTGFLMKNVFNFALPRTAKAQYHATKRISKSNLKEGDLVFFNTIGGISHVGVYLQNGYFTHSGCSKGVTISSLNEGYYNNRFISGGRY